MKIFIEHYLILDLFRLLADREVLENQVEDTHDKFEQLQVDFENIRQIKEDQSQTVEETATLIRELRDKLLESQSDVTRLKKRLEGTVASKVLWFTCHYYNILID